jgi:hypothetical protein
MQLKVFSNSNLYSCGPTYMYIPQQENEYWIVSVIYRDEIGRLQSNLTHQTSRDLLHISPGPVVQKKFVHCANLALVYR